MNPDPEHFDDLKKLLALKRMEQPPPGYFNRFSSKVRARVVAGETPPERRTWWDRWFGVGELKPALVGLYACAIGAVLWGGYRASLKIEQSYTGPMPPEESWQATHTRRTLAESARDSSNPLQQPIVLSESNIVPAVLNGENIFNSSLKTTPASFKPTVAH